MGELTLWDRFKLWVGEMLCRHEWQDSPPEAYRRYQECMKCGGYRE